MSRTLSIQRALVGALLALSAAGFWRGTFDVFNTFKATVVALGAIAVLTVAAVRALRTRRLGIPATRMWWVLGAFAAALAVATAVSDTTMLSVVGRTGRHTGLVMYLCYAALLAVAVSLYRDHPPTGLVAWLLAAAAPITVYGLLQAAGLEALGWETPEGGPPVFSTFGNANFFAAWLGIVTPLAVWAVLEQRHAPWVRAAAALIALGAVLAGFASGSLQGPATAAVGSLVVLLVWPFTLDGPLHRRRWVVVGGLGATLAAVGAGLAAGLGPLAAIRDAGAASLATRVPKWQTAVAVWRDHPVAGVGLDDFADWFHRYRPEQVAALDGLRRTTDTPHNVPLDMLANGGVLLAGAYLALVGVVAAALVVGLRRRQGAERLLLAAFGGAWIAYQVQSLVSIDVPPLAALGWVLGGVVVGFGLGSPLRAVALLGAPPVPQQRRRKRDAGPLLVPLHPVGAGLVAAVALLACWAVLTPVRADRWGAEAVALENAGDVERAVAAWERAAGIAPWESRYPLQQGRLLGLADDTQGALESFLDAQAREPRSLNAALNVAQLTDFLGDPRAEQAHDRLLELDPRTPEVLVEVGRYRLARGEVVAAGELLERAVTLRDDNADWWLVLGEARSAQGDADGAEEAFRRAAELDPMSR